MRDAVHGLTPREITTLDAVERRLTNQEIAAELQLSVRTVESHIAALRRKLAVDSRTALIIAAGERHRTDVHVPHNSFVGRDHELHTLVDLLEHERWVTVVGPAGAGKTRLVLELARSDGRAPVVVALEHATTDGAASMLARALGVVPDGTDLVAAASMSLQASPRLLVLDNVDRVVGTIATIVGRLLATTHSLTVLATSQSPVGGSGECVYTLAPLPVGPDALTGGVRLFLDRARSAAPGIDIRPDETPLVAEICQRLDGLPLAIELAAARVRHLPLSELARRLDSGFSALESAGTDGRHRTLETAFDWTWDLLDHDEKTVLSHLAALPRTFDLHLATVVAGEDAGDTALRLLDRSVIAPAVTMAEPRRFRLLESLRSFVLDRTDRQTIHDVRRIHASFHARVATSFAARARTDDSRETALGAKNLCPEFNAALDWALDEASSDALLLARALSIGTEQFAPDSDSLAAIGRAARDPGVLALATADDLLVLGTALSYVDLDIVQQLAVRALGIADDPASRLAAHHLAGLADGHCSRPESARAHLRIAEDLAREQDDRWQLASVFQSQGIALRSIDPAEAIAVLATALETFAIVGDAMHVNSCRYMMAATAAGAGIDLERARLWVDQCEEYATGCGNEHAIAHAVLTRAHLSGRAQQADVEAALTTFRAVGDLRCLTRSYLLLALDLPAREQLPLLEHALDAARAAHDVTHQAAVLEQLISARWRSGAHRIAAVALGELSALIGNGAAADRAPPPMIAELDQWETTLAEGRARGQAGEAGEAATSR